MFRTNIYLKDRQTERLDRIATDQGVSRAEVIRRIIDRALAGTDDDLAADLAAIGGSFGALRDLEAPDRGPDQRQRHLDRLWGESS